MAFVFSKIIFLVNRIWNSFNNCERIKYSTYFHYYYYANEYIVILIN